MFGPIIKEKVLHLYSVIYPESTQAFKASSGWLHRFCVNHGIRVFLLQGKLLSADMTTVEPFHSTFKELMEKKVTVKIKFSMQMKLDDGGG